PLRAWKARRPGPRREEPAGCRSADRPRWAPRRRALSPPAAPRHRARRHAQARCPPRAMRASDRRGGRCCGVDAPPSSPVSSPVSPLASSSHVDSVHLSLPTQLWTVYTIPRRRTTIPSLTSSPGGTTMQVQPYLFFDGRADEAVAFYRKTLG